MRISCSLQRVCAQVETRTIVALRIFCSCSKVCSFQRISLGLAACYYYKEFLCTLTFSRATFSLRLEKDFWSSLCLSASIEASFSWVCPVIDHEFRQPSRSADYFDNVITRFIVNNRADALKTDINLLFYNKKLSNYPLSLVYALHKL